MRFMKNKLFDLLRSYNYSVSYLCEDQISGINLFHDLKVLIPTNSPLCLDVGANRGQTIEKFQKIFKQPKIHAFEPSREMFRILQAQGYDNQTSLYNFALGPSHTKGKFINYEDTCLSSFLPLQDHADNRFREVAIKSEEEVEVKTLDWFISQQGFDTVDILKIDTQGYDLQVLLGAQESFRRGIIRAVFVELIFIPMYEGQNDGREIIDFLAKNDIHLVDFYEKVRQNNTLSWCTALFSKINS